MVPPQTHQPLGQLASIRTGFPFRKRIEPEENGNLRVIQMGDLNRNALRVRDAPTKVSIPDIDEEMLLKEGDILFSGKGVNNEAIVMQEISEPTVATSTLFVIRPTRDVLPGYIAWYMNQSRAQDYFRRHGRGTSMPMVTKSVLEELEIPLPPPEVQKSIASVDRLLRRESELMEQLREHRTELITGILLARIDQ